MNAEVKVSLQIEADNTQKDLENFRKSLFEMSLKVDSFKKGEQELLSTFSDDINLRTDRRVNQIKKEMDQYKLFLKKEREKALLAQKKEMTKLIETKVIDLDEQIKQVKAYTDSVKMALTDDTHQYILRMDNMKAAQERYDERHKDFKQEMKKMLKKATEAHNITLKEKQTEIEGNFHRAIGSYFKAQEAKQQKKLEHKIQTLLA